MIEAYLTTFERVMEAYSMERRKWATIRSSTESLCNKANDYEQLKAIKHYDIVYRQHHQREEQVTLRTGGEATSLMAEMRCKSTQQWSRLVVFVMEQFLNSLTPDLHVSI